MDDISVIRSKNNKATKEAEIKKLKAEGFAVLVKKRPGIDDIAEFKTFTTAAGARQAAVSLDGIWHVA